MLIIGISGGTSSGKTTITQKIYNNVSDNIVASINQDSFYLNANANSNFDIPESIEFNLMYTVISDFILGKEVDIPIYDFKTHKRSNTTKKLSPKGVKILILEGTLIFAIEKIRSLCNYKIFINADDDIRLLRRIVRDIAERGRVLKGILEQWMKTVKPAHEKYVIPSKQYADLIIENNKENEYDINKLCNLLEIGDLDNPYIHSYVLESFL